MYAKARRRAEKRPVEDTVRYRPNDIRVIGAHADYRREDFIFPRTQSLATARAGMGKPGQAAQALGAELRRQPRVRDLRVTSH